MDFKAMTPYRGGKSHPDILGEGSSISVRDDVTLRESIQKLHEQKKISRQIDEDIKDLLDPDRNKAIQRIWRGIKGGLIPKKLTRNLPVGIKHAIGEEDIFEALEYRMRENILTTEGALAGMAICAKNKFDEIEGLSADIKRARDENWTAADLQAYIASQVGIPIYKEVAFLLSVEFKGLSDTKKEERKNYLLGELEASIHAGERLLETLGEACSVGLQVFDRSMVHYYAYINIYRPVKALADAAEDLANMNIGNYASKEAIVRKFNAAIDLLDSTLEAADHAEKYSVVSPGVCALFFRSREQLRASLTKHAVMGPQEDPAEKVSIQSQ